MRLLDVLLGRTKPVRSKLDRLFAISTAYPTLTVNLGLEPSGRAGICFRPLPSSRFANARAEIEGLLRIAAQTAGTNTLVSQDEYGFTWLIMEDTQFEDLVAGTHMVSSALEEQGFGTRLLAATFKFIKEGRDVYWIYSYKRGTWYPFVPKQGVHDRDNATELRLRAVMERELPIESDLERWYPLWGAPL